VPVAVRPKGKAVKIREAIMGPLPNDPSKGKKKIKSKVADDRLAFEETSRVR
jgi:hypothetical protein